MVLVVQVHHLIVAQSIYHLICPFKIMFRKAFSKSRHQSQPQPTAPPLSPQYNRGPPAAPGAPGPPASIPVPTSGSDSSDFKADFVFDASHALDGVEEDSPTSPTTSSGSLTGPGTSTPTGGNAGNTGDYYYRTKASSGSKSVLAPLAEKMRRRGLFPVVGAGRVEQQQPVGDHYNNLNNGTGGAALEGRAGTDHRDNFSKESSTNSQDSGTFSGLLRQYPPNVRSNAVVVGRGSGGTSVGGPGSRQSSSSGAGVRQEELFRESSSPGGSSRGASSSHFFDALRGTTSEQRRSGPLVFSGISDSATQQLHVERPNYKFNPTGRGDTTRTSLYPSLDDDKNLVHRYDKDKEDPPTPPTHAGGAATPSTSSNPVFQSGNEDARSVTPRSVTPRSEDARSVTPRSVTPRLAVGRGPLRARSDCSSTPPPVYELINRGRGGGTVGAPTSDGRTPESYPLFTAAPIDHVGGAGARDLGLRLDPSTLRPNAGLQALLHRPSTPLDRPPSSASEAAAFQQARGGTTPRGTATPPSPGLDPRRTRPGPDYDSELEHQSSSLLLETTASFLQKTTLQGPPGTSSAPGAGPAASAPDIRSSPEALEQDLALAKSRLDSLEVQLSAEKGRLSEKDVALDRVNAALEQERQKMREVVQQLENSTNEGLQLRAQLSEASDQTKTMRISHEQQIKFLREQMAERETEWKGRLREMEKELLQSQLCCNKVNCSPHGKAP